MNFIISKNLTKSQHTYLYDKFHYLFETLPYPFSKQLQEFIFQKYQEPHRAYHNLSHIYNLLQLSDEHLADENKAFEIAIWYHDIIYNPAKQDNEIKSADLFIKHFLKDEAFNNFINEENISWTKQAIIQTKGHRPSEHDDMINLFLDLDLSILAADEKTYSQYSKAIRKEYNIYEDKLYNVGRIKVLEHFLERKEIYFTKNFKPLEPIARKNIKQEINLLQSKIF